MARWCNGPAERETGSMVTQMGSERVTAESAEIRYSQAVLDKMELEKLLEESDGTVNELTNQVIELETRLRDLELENEMLRKAAGGKRRDGERTDQSGDRAGDEAARPRARERNAPKGAGTGHDEERATESAD